MGYYNNDRRGYNGGGGYGGRGYNNDRRGYNGGYDGPRDRFDGRGYQFEIGEKVLHKATGQELSVISFGREQIECRLPDLSTGYFYEHELEPISNAGQDNKNNK